VCGRTDLHDDQGPQPVAHRRERARAAPRLLCGAPSFITPASVRRACANGRRLARLTRSRAGRASCVPGRRTAAARPRARGAELVRARVRAERMGAARSPELRATRDGRVATQRRGIEDLGAEPPKSPLLTLVSAVLAVVATHRQQAPTRRGSRSPRPRGSRFGRPAASAQDGETWSLRSPRQTSASCRSLLAARGRAWEACRVPSMVCGRCRAGFANGDGA
jgi:hypothetical protein